MPVIRTIQIRKLACLLSMLIFAALAQAACAETVMTFDELPFQSVNGLSFVGVTFDFTIDGVDSPDAFYNSFGPGGLAAVEDPSLTGDSAGILRIDFDFPTSLLEFGVALNTGDSLTPGVEVELFDTMMQSLGSTALDTTATLPSEGFSEAHFAYSGEPISRVTLDFADHPGSFALDNLVYIVPEPSMLGLLFAAVLVLLSRRLGARHCRL